MNNNFFNIKHDYKSIYRVWLFSFLLNRNILVGFVSLVLIFFGIFSLIKGIQSNKQIKTIGVLNKINNNFEAGFFSGKILLCLISIFQLGFLYLVI